MTYFINITIIFSIILLFSVSCQKIDGEKTDMINAADLMDNYITDPEITISKKNIISLKATANFLTKNDTEDAKLSGEVVADFFDDLGLHKSILFSDSAVINESNNNFTAFGNVTLVSDSGFTLLTDIIFWDNNYRKIVSNDSVMFTSDNMDTLYGVGFESDMDLLNWKILKPTGVTYREIE